MELYACKSMQALVVAAMVLLAPVSMGRTPESPRPLLYDKGTYSGSADTRLNGATVEAHCAAALTTIANSGI